MNFLKKFILLFLTLVDLKMAFSSQIKLPNEIISHQKYFLASLLKIGTNLGERHCMLVFGGLKIWRMF